MAKSDVEKPQGKLDNYLSEEQIGDFRRIAIPIFCLALNATVKDRNYSFAGATDALRGYPNLAGFMFSFDLKIVFPMEYTLMIH